MEESLNDTANALSTLSLQRDINSKREDYLEWDEYFMAIAFLASMRSKDPCTQVGACIVNSENRIVGVGYNGFPMGCHDDEFSWKKVSSDPLDLKYLYVCHAEVNAILSKNTLDLKNCRMYVALFPCNECAKIIIQSGLKSVIYMSDKYAHETETLAAKKMFHAAGVRYRQYVPKSKKITIDFDQINSYNLKQLPSNKLNDSK